jgi:hypothetical protein
LARIFNELVPGAKEEATVAPRASPRIEAEEALDPFLEEATALGALDSLIMALRTFHKTSRFSWGYMFRE